MSVTTRTKISGVGFMGKQAPKEKPQQLNATEKQLLIETLRTVGVRPTFLNLIENQKILYKDRFISELITLAARAHPDLAIIHDKFWEKIIRENGEPEAAPQMKDSRR